MKKYLYLFCFILIGVGFFTRNDYRASDNFKPETFEEPSQITTSSTKPIKFTRDGFAYIATPLYDYQISGLVVSRRDYNRWFSLSGRTGSAYPTDLCIIWGDNLVNKVNKQKNVQFSQDSRFCRFKWSGQVDLNQNQVSNNHLLFKDKSLEKKLAAINAGDQVRIIGQLVNVEGKNLETGDPLEFNQANWITSTTRTDTGAGACEIILVEDIEVIHQANFWQQFVYRFGWVLFALLFAHGTFNLFYQAHKATKQARTDPFLDDKPKGF